ncbi:DUF2913 domain-containing protein [Photobacterium gaetbulicola]|uniref:DUF2913 family protein n=1 Tax=Photobacterium gaetbulicola Gung47 TaxID=658445 RepID=A0A0C5WP41_9GAMM|nr:DUF2913 family protein [Photobacterium gaetbulicola]AJR08908.1 hypothetical protein H744_2c2245 [Photobacterium gaetbulicola Gung47]PSU13460.1 DUF2913 domain-containing protein [Photobacterium gaetbulicola]
MATFYQEIYKVVSQGLQELMDSQQAGKTPKNPVSETLYLNAWVTKVIKQQRYDHVVAKTLVDWQKQARSMGKNAQLKSQFEQIKSCYEGIPQDGEVTGTLHAHTLHDSQLKALYGLLEEHDWLVTTEYEVNRKVTHHTDGQASLVVCSAQYAAAFDDSGEMVKPLSLFVRGDTRQFIDLAYAQGLLLYKVTDYKSIVKYHGEYKLFPRNAGTHLPELPAQQ